MNNQLEKIYSLFLSANQSVSTDTRRIAEGSLFFALRGENFNGNTFAEEALKKGAAYSVVDEKVSNYERIILVENVLETLQQLSNHHRKQLKAKVIAITGSNGKTTTKELVNAVLQKKFKTYSTQGNLNNHIGVPLTLLALTSQHEFAVVEMGANHQGEIELLSNIAEPNFGLITNVGKAHLEGFGGFEGVKKGKGELYDYLKNKKGKIFIHGNDKVLMEMCNEYKNIITYGINEEFDCVGKIIPISSNKDSPSSPSLPIPIGILTFSISPYLKISWHSKNNQEDEIISSQLTGNYNFENIVAAICIGNYFGVENNSIKDAIENYSPSNQRSQVIMKGSNTLILDYYNANPTSMEAALVNFKNAFVTTQIQAEDTFVETQTQAKKTQAKIVILGDMLELGNESKAEHLHIIHLIKKLNFSKIILVGEIFGSFSKEINAEFFDTSAKAKIWLQDQNFSNASILIKGSRGLKLEQVMEAFAN